MNNKGFTLIEIAVTAVIVGILGMMAIPNFIKMVNRSYAQDAMRNLMAVYSAEQNYAQNHDGVYLACANLACINDSAAGLGLSIVPANSNMTFSCEIATNTCQVTALAAAGGFTMTLTLANPVTINQAPVYCSGTTYNPCCSSAGTAGANCP